MSNQTKQHMQKLLADNIRLDGRTTTDFREVSVEYGIIGSAEGSARVTVGDTEVIAGVKFALDKPYPDTKDKGNLMVNAELLPLSSPHFEPGPPSAAAVEIARVVDRTIRESHLIDLSKLCIEKGEKVWGVMIDVCSINAAGNLLDVAGLAAMAALQNARFPEVKEGTLDYRNLTDKHITLEAVSIPVTVFKLGDTLFVDPVTAEEKLSDARVTFGIRDDGKVCAIQKGTQGTVTVEELDTMLTLALEKAKELRGKLQQ